MQPVTVWPEWSTKGSGGWRRLTPRIWAIGALLSISIRTGDLAERLLRHYDAEVA